MIGASDVTKRIPAIIAIFVANGGGDSKGSERGLEYDTLSDRYAQFVETEVLPLVRQRAGVSLTSDPDGRAASGMSSGGIAAFTMAWFHPEHYRRMLAYSITEGYHVQFVFARNAQHSDGPVRRQTLPEALEYTWQGYPIR